MGPRILHWGKGETEYSLRLLPIGGFCAMEGEDGSSEDPRSFTAKAPWKRAIILAAGAFMNFLTGLAFLTAHLGIPREAVCAFGNADNDADMLEWAGMGIAVANGSPACLAAADAVTGHYLEDGVAQAFDGLLGIH